MLMIDVFNHIFPKLFLSRLIEKTGTATNMLKRSLGVKMLVDLDRRFEVMDLFGPDYRQILSLGSPPIETLVAPGDMSDLARAGNDGMAELVSQYPARFPGFIASLAMNDAGAALAEAKRAIEQLDARGIQLYTNVNGKPLDAPEFQPLFAYMAAQDLPVWLHPARSQEVPDYASEAQSLYEIWWTFGWPYETSVAMSRMVFSKMLDRLPNLKVITHHMGGMIPYFAGRIGPGWDVLGSRTSGEDYRKLLTELKHRPHDYFKMFYADTALFGAKAATECGLEFFGADRVLFASDTPYDPEGGSMFIRETIRIIRELDITEEQREKIFHGNAERLLRLC
jgi:uncharacterized protein